MSSSDNNNKVIHFYFGASNRKSTIMEKRTKDLLEKFNLGNVDKKISFEWWSEDNRNLLVEHTAKAKEDPSRENLERLKSIRAYVGLKEYRAIKEETDIVILFFDDDTVEYQRGTHMEFTMALDSERVQEIYVVASKKAWSIIEPITFYNIPEARLFVVENEEELVKKVDANNTIPLK